MNYYTGCVDCTWVKRGVVSNNNPPPCADQCGSGYTYTSYSGCSNDDYYKCLCYRPFAPVLARIARSSSPGIPKMSLELTIPILVCYPILSLSMTYYLYNKDYIMQTRLDLKTIIYIVQIIAEFCNLDKSRKCDDDKDAKDGR